MIFYFTGTGNSYSIAKSIANAQGEKLISIAKELDKKASVLEYKLKENELLGFVFPVYAWAPPKIVLDFISRLKISGSKPYVFSFCTCGEEGGNSTRILQKCLSKNGLLLDSGFSVIMPNNYIVGMDVDSKEVALEKLQNAQEKLQGINSVLEARQTGVFQTLPGKLPTLKSLLVNPLFNRFALNTKKFFATEKCTGCGICEKLCPIHTITINDKPVWRKNCTQCFACINTCPVKAIQYGKGTINKGRYQHPELKNMHAQENIV